LLEKHKSDFLCSAEDFLHPVILFAFVYSENIFHNLYYEYMNYELQFFIFQAEVIQCMLRVYTAAEVMMSVKHLYLRDELYHVLGGKTAETSAGRMLF
jgi:hypothetical protein